MPEQLFIVWEDNHGDVSYWTNEEDAKREYKKILHDMYSDKELEEILEEDGDFDNCAGYRSVDLNKSWLD